MLDKREMRSEALDLLRFPLAIVIVVVHALPLGSNVMDDFVMAFLKEQSVPIYYFISGYVFFFGIELTKVVYVKKIRNRIKTLFIPYLIWNLLFFAYNSINASIFRLEDFFKSFWCIYTDLSNKTYPVNYPLWFLRDLMIAVLCTPLINWSIKKFRYFYLIPIGVVWLSANLYNYGRIAQLASAFFFFSFGAYMSINKKDIIYEFGKYSKLSTFLFIFLGCCYLGFVRILPDVAYAIMFARVLVGLVFAYNISVFLLRRGQCNVNKFLAQSSFFIYLSHVWFLERISRLIFRLIDTNSTFLVIVGHIMTIVVTILVLLLLYLCGKRFVPTLFKVMIGGR